MTRTALALSYWLVATASPDPGAYVATVVSAALAYGCLRKRRARVLHRVQIAYN